VTGRLRRSLISASVLCLLALSVAGCGGRTAGTTQPKAADMARGEAPASAPSEAPAAIVAAGRIRFCSDITYPPEEFYRGRKPVGSDIDIGKAIARLFGVRAVFRSTAFDRIIPTMLAGKCDAILSGLNDTAARRKQVAFVDYLSVGQSLMVQSGNPHRISSLTSLAGKTVSVEAGTTNADFLRQRSAALEKRGQRPITVLTFQDDTAAAAALRGGRAAAYFGDSPVVAHYIAEHPSEFGFGGQPIDPLPVGIAFRRRDPAMRRALEGAVRTMYANGTMQRLLAHWQMSDFALREAAT
jgi:polar amino acid transport system substrate-binding protein